MDTITAGVVEARAGGEGTPTVLPPEDMDIELQDDGAAEDSEKENESKKENESEKEYIEECDISLLAIPSTHWATENDDATYNYTQDIDYDIDDIQ